MHGATVDPTSTPARCGGCAADLSALPTQATFCPGCGRRLRPARSIWRTTASTVARLWRGKPLPPVPDGPRAPIVVGYGNALWRLGWRYEHGRGTTRNVPEALRCYRKSAGLGNAEAQSRLAVNRAGPTPVLVVEDDG